MLRRASLFTALAAFLVLLVGALISWQAREAWVSAERRVGISLDEGDGGLEVVGVEAGLAAERAGLQVGDLILSINGAAVRDFPEYDRAAASLERGKPGIFGLSRGGKGFESPVIPGEDFPWLSQILQILATLGYLAVSLFALLHESRDPRARLLFAFCASVAVELALPEGIGASPATLSAIFSAFYLLTGFQIGLEIHLASSIPSRLPLLERRRWILPLVYVAGLGLGAVVAIASVLEDHFPEAGIPFWSFASVEGVFFDIGVPVWAIAASGILIYQIYRAREARGRQQAGLVFAGALPWVVFTLLLSWTRFPELSGPLGVSGVEALVLACYPVAIFTAIFRHHLFDLGLVVKRSLIATTLAGAVLLIFYGALGAGGVLVSRFFGTDNSLWSVGLATLVLGLLFAPVKRFVEGLIERQFFPERKQLRQALVSLAEDLAHQGHAKNMGEYLVTVLRPVLAVESATLLLSGPHRGSLAVLATTRSDLDESAPSSRFVLEKPDHEVLLQGARPVRAHEIFATSSLSRVRPALQNAEYLLPLHCRGRLTGVLVLGPKKDQLRFSEEELELLSLMMHHVAIVFENARLQDSAKIESVTGLLRRETTLELLGHELTRALRYRRPLTVGVCDLDLFKSINDRFGHLAGDALLRSVSDAMASALRTTDLLGRFGGDEFLIVLPETDLNGAVTVAEKIRRRVQKDRLVMEDGREASVTVSIGLASLHRFQVVGRSGPSARDLIAAADNALYHAKGQGRNRVSTQSLPRGEKKPGETVRLS